MIFHFNLVDGSEPYKGSLFSSQGERCPPDCCTGRFWSDQVLLGQHVCSELRQDRDNDLAVVGLGSGVQGH